MDWLTTNTPLIIGHRGASAGAPENTLAAFALAQEQGADGVELDVQFSADGQIVIMHDATVDRTTNGTGRVTDLTLAQLQALDAGAGQTIPTLDELFEAFGPSLLYNIEIKDWGWRDHHLELAVADRIAAYHLERQVLVSSFNPLSVRRARRCLTRATLVGMIRQPRWLRWPTGWPVVRRTIPIMRWWTRAIWPGRGSMVIGCMCGRWTTRPGRSN